MPCRHCRDGHVGIVRGTDGAGNIIVISGNHGNKVWESPYPKSRVLGMLMGAMFEAAFRRFAEAFVAVSAV